ncbi:MAG: hypothetical protein ACRD3D_14355 [Terriglobia bacterium]
MNRNSDGASFARQASVRPPARLRVVLAALASLLFPLPLLAAGHIAGRAMNGTTNRAAAGEEVELLQPGNGGMRQVAATRTAADGSFAFSSDSILPDTFYLLQARYEGVAYHAPVRLGSKPDVRTDLRIYDASPAPPVFHVTSARLLVRAQGSRLRVEELYALRNSATPPVAYVSRGGTFRFNLGKDAGEPTVAVAGELNMPLPQVAQPGAQRGEYSIAYPIKPGLTVVMVAYEADYASSSFTLADSVPYAVDQVELDVVPSSLAVASRLFKPAGRDEDTGGQKFIAASITPGESFGVGVQGSYEAAASGDTSDETVKEAPNAMSRIGLPLIGCFLLVLLWGMGVRVSKEWARRGASRPGSPAQKELEAKIGKLLDSVANLDELFEAGKIHEKKYWRERLDLKARLVVALKTTPPAFIESYATRRSRD